MRPSVNSKMFLLLNSTLPQSDESRQYLNPHNDKSDGDHSSMASASGTSVRGTTAHFQRRDLHTDSTSVVPLSRPQSVLIR